MGFTGTRIWQAVAGAHGLPFTLLMFMSLFLSLHQSANHRDPCGDPSAAADAHRGLLPVPQIPEPGEILVSSSPKHPGTNKGGECADWKQVTQQGSGAQAQRLDFQLVELKAGQGGTHLRSQHPRGRRH